MRLRLRDAWARARRRSRCPSRPARGSSRPCAPRSRRSGPLAVARLLVGARGGCRRASGSASSRSCDVCVATVSFSTWLASSAMKCAFGLSSWFGLACCRTAMRRSFSGSSGSTSGFFSSSFLTMTTGFCFGPSSAARAASAPPASRLAAWASPPACGSGGGGGGGGGGGVSSLASSLGAPRLTSKVWPSCLARGCWPGATASRARSGRRASARRPGRPCRRGNARRRPRKSKGREGW